MISLEKAKALKELGLAWEPKRGDRYLDTNTNIVRISNSKKKILAWLEVWLPSLSQLLAEIRQRGYVIMLNIPSRAQIAVSKRCEFEYITEADTPEDAAADALLWILEQEASQ